MQKEGEGRHKVITDKPWHLWAQCLISQPLPLSNASEQHQAVSDLLFMLRNAQFAIVKNWLSYLLHLCTVYKPKATWSSLAAHQVKGGCKGLMIINWVQISASDLSFYLTLKSITKHTVNGHTPHLSSERTVYFLKKVTGKFWMINSMFLKH